MRRPVLPPSPEPVPGSPECPVCDSGRYRLHMRNMFNPWVRGGSACGTFNPWSTNAGANPVPGDPGYSGTGDIPGKDVTYEPPAGFQSQTGDKGGGGAGGGSPGGGGAGSIDYNALLQTGLTQGASLLRQQMAADAARADQAARDAAETARRTADAARQAGVRSTQRGIESAPASSGGGGNTLLLLGLAAVAGVATGVVKLPKGMGGR